MSAETCYFLVEDGVVIQKDYGFVDGWISGSCEWSPGALYSNGEFSNPPPDWLLINTQALIDAQRSLALQFNALMNRAEVIADATDLGIVTAAETAEALTLAQPLHDWRTYRVLLGRVTSQSTWPENPVWPTPPAAWPA